jgi:hypothetical protein
LNSTKQTDIYEQESTFNADLPNSDEPAIAPIGVDSVCFNMGEHLFNRLEKHLFNLSCIEDQRQSKQRWIIEAIKEKMERDFQSEDFSMPRFRKVFLKISKPLNRKLDSIISMIKKVRGSFSKKQLIVEAIQEKLEKDEPKINHSLKKIRQQPLE